MASQTPKGASQRLLTMKFMQRAAAAASSPTSPSTLAPASDEGRSSKRRKTAGRSSVGTPETPSYVIDQKAAQAALEEDERRRQAAVDRRAEELGDSHWALDVTKLPHIDRNRTPLMIVQVGFSQIDRRGGGEDDQDEHEPSRADWPSFQTYGPKEKANKGENDNDGDSNSDSDSDSSGSSDSSSESSSQEASRGKAGRASYGSQKRHEIKSRQGAGRDRAQKLAKERRQKEVKLNTLTSISGAASNNFGRRR